MSNYFHIYKKRIGEGTGDKRAYREAEAKALLNAEFRDIAGWQESYLWDRNFVDKGYKEATEIDTVFSIGANGYEHKISFRPDFNINTGTYIISEGLTYIIREKIAQKPHPTYKGFLCQQVLRLKGCPVDFPCFSYNSTYSSKGLIDNDQLYTLDSRNKIYIQKNNFSARIFEHYHGYRVRLGDQDGFTSFKITEMDDFSYKGMYIVSLKVDQRHHLDGVEDPYWAYNDYLIDFSDLIHEGAEISPVQDPLLYGDSYYDLNSQVEVICNKNVAQWGYDEDFFSDVVTDDRTFLATAIKIGKTTLSVIDEDGKAVSKTFIVKGVD